MTRAPRAVRVLPWLCAALLMPLASISGVDAQAERVRFDGTRFIDAESGKAVTLTGVNIGNWLLLEPWMLAVPTDGPEGFRDQHDIVSVLEARFGRERAERWLDVYRSSWFTERDAAIIRDFGMRVIRVPFHYSLLLDDERSRVLRPDAFEWLDRAVELARGAGLLVILDLHGAPGGQSIDMPTGRIDQNRLWHDEELRRVTAWLWGRIAARYAEEPVVIGYDLLNEPYGDFETDLSAELIALMDDIIAEVRREDPRTAVFLPGQFSGIEFYGDPAARGWTRAGFTEHFYPGIFGGEERSLRRHARFIASDVHVRRAQMLATGAPFLVGEFNTIFESIGGARLLAEQVRAFEAHGWITTLWAYRLHRNDGRLPADNWTMVTNAEPFSFDLRGASYEELLMAAERLGRVPLEHDAAMLDAFTRPGNAAHLVPDMPAARLAPPEPVSPEGWSVLSIGGASPGALEQAEDGFVLVGGGEDIFGRADSFVWALPVTPVTPAASRSVSVEVRGFEAYERYAKGGVMVRAGASADAPHASVHVLPSGEVRMLWRVEPGGPSFERPLAVSAWPVRVGVSETGNGLLAWAADGAGVLAQEPFPAEATLREGAASGVFVLSHADPACAVLELSRPAFGVEALPAAATTPPIDGRRYLIEHAEGWHWWGDRVSFSAVGLRLSPGSGHRDIGAWRDVDVSGGGWRTLLVEARRLGPAADLVLELRTESLDDASVLTLASESLDAALLPADGRWVRLALETPIPSDAMRVLFRVVGADHRSEASAVELRSIQVVER
ncbi:MAG: cellulase family glycosylhydrolase [Phycisphaerales bacterium]